MRSCPCFVLPVHTSEISAAATQSKCVGRKQDMTVRLFLLFYLLGLLTDEMIEKDSLNHSECHSA